MKKRILGYFVNSSVYDNKYMPDFIPSDDLTHLNYCFLNIKENGSLEFSDEHIDIGCIGKINKLKEECPHLKVGFSISSIRNFSNVCNDRIKRNKLIEDCIYFAKKYNFFDHIDIFWYNCLTYDNYENNICLAFFIIELKKALRPYPNCKITISSPMEIEYINSMKLDIITKHINAFNLISFNYLDNETKFQYNSSIWGKKGLDRIVKYYIRLGVPSNKIVICSSLIGKIYFDININDKGFKKKDKIGYKFINKDNMIWDYEVGTNFTFNKKNKILITFDNSRSIKEKIKYINYNKLLGISFWGIEYDTQNNSMIHSANQLIDNADDTISFNYKEYINKLIL